MENITLEERLREYAEKDREQYEALLSTWLHNKKRCAILLDSVSDNYVYYSTHSAEHSDMVLRNIERLLDNHRIRLLSATDIWLILHSAYMHDLGMVIPYEEYTKVWENSEFQEYLKECQHSTNSDLCEASIFLSELSKTTGKNAQPDDWSASVRVKRASVIVISEYFRRRHAERIKPYVENPYENGRLSFDNVNNRRIVNLIQRVSCLHTADSDELMKLEQETVGFGRDLAHPRFIAELLRLGDALDLDAGRFSPDFNFLHGKRPKYSQAHADLHDAVTDFLIKPEKVIYRANYQNRNSYLLAQTLTGYLTEEFRFCALNWPKIVPENFPGPVPQFQFSMRDDLRIKDKPDHLGLAGLRFTLSEKKAFELLQGFNIYSDNMVFIRELLQNALDASKIQIWRDIQNRFECRRGIPQDVEDRDLQPYHIPRELFENYPIDIRIRKVPEEELRKEEQVPEDASDKEQVIEIAFEDHGTGFTVESVKRMCEVTESYSYPGCKKELADMPEWLKPTGGFGIGLQSAFLETDEIRVDTQSDDGVHLSMTIESPTRRSGAVIVEILDKPRKAGRGSTLTLRMKKAPEKTYNVATFETQSVSYDETLYEKVKEFFSEKCLNSMFPVTAHWGKKTCAPKGVDFQEMFPQSERIDWENDCYALSQDGTWIEFWDKKTASIVHWELCRAPLGNKIGAAFFKGMQFDCSDITPKELCDFYADCWIDAYGLSAEDSLELNRETLKESKKKTFQEVIRRTGQAYMDILAKRIQDEFERGPENPELLIREPSKNSALMYNDDEDIGCFRFEFWMSAEPETRESLSKEHADWFRDSNITAKCLVMESGHCDVRDMKPEELIAQYASLPCAFVDPDDMTQNNCRLIFEAVRQMPTPYREHTTIICSVVRLREVEYRAFTIGNLPELVKKISAICIPEGKTADVYRLGFYPFSTLVINFYDNSSKALGTNPIATNLILKLCVRFVSMRMYLPVLSDYELLKLKKAYIHEEIEPVPCGFPFPAEYVIISPITSDDMDALDEKSTPEDFASYLESTEPFQKLAAYVAQCAKTPLQEERDEDEIKKQYLKLAKAIWMAYHKADTENPSQSAETPDKADKPESADVSTPEESATVDVKEETNYE